MMVRQSLPSYVATVTADRTLTLPTEIPVGATIAIMILPDDRGGAGSALRYARQSKQHKQGTRLRPSPTKSLMCVLNGRGSSTIRDARGIRSLTCHLHRQDKSRHSHPQPRRGFGSR